MKQKEREHLQRESSMNDPLPVWHTPPIKRICDDCINSLGENGCDVYDERDDITKAIIYKNCPFFIKKHSNE